ncbi:Uncharacterized protein FKW44_015952 [Caligus rogercresseyi]|uniref:Uncharacterized protein n=1 Tax=Caligus rogercresseyi TaxID=217165 RepID=A0A7T8K0S8_CALRO|nr:Uncharacterized protein FKW44_015952 [Caligus rogercresseyi]
MDRIRQSSRLERLISKLPRITIRSWAPPSNKPALHIKSAASMLKAESFYPLVDAIASSGVAPPPKGPLRIKAATKTISAESPRVASTAKSLPVTPTIARIKTEPLHQAVPSPLHSSGSLLLTPDMKRVKVEISGSSPIDPLGDPHRGSGTSTPWMRPRPHRIYRRSDIA